MPSRNKNFTPTSYRQYGRQNGARKRRNGRVIHSEVEAAPPSYSYRTSDNTRKPCLLQLSPTPLLFRLLTNSSRRGRGLGDYKTFTHLTDHHLDHTGHTDHLAPIVPVMIYCARAVIVQIPGGEHVRRRCNRTDPRRPTCARAVTYPTYPTCQIGCM